MHVWAIAFGCVPMLWDTNYPHLPSGTLIDRKNCEVYNQYAMDGISEGVAAAHWPASTGIVAIDSENTVRDNKTYNLMGLPVGSGYRGIVVSGGRKLVNR